MLAKFLIPGIVFGLSLVFGFWLSQAGKPYNGVLFNIHKLLALGAVIGVGWQAFHWLRGAGAPGASSMLLAGAALLVVILFAGGALMSMNKLEYMLVLNTHRAAAVALVLALGIWAYLLRRAL